MAAKKVTGVTAPVGTRATVPRPNVSFKPISTPDFMAAAANRSSGVKTFHGGGKVDFDAILQSLPRAGDAGSTVGPTGGSLPLTDLQKQHESDQQRMVANSLYGKNLGDKAAVLTAAATGDVAKHLGRDVTSMSPEIQKLYASVEAKEIINKGKVQNKKNKSLLHRTMDILSRGNYAVANAFDATDAAGKKGDNPGEMLAATIDGAWEGLKGKKKLTFSKLIEHDAERNKHGVSAGIVEHKKIKATVGLIADIGLDPTSYVGLGLVKDVAKGAGVLNKATKATKALEVTRAADADALAKTFAEHGVVVEGAETAGKEVNEAAISAKLNPQGLLGENKAVPTHVTNHAVVKDMHKFVDSSVQTVQKSIFSRETRRILEESNVKLLEPVKASTEKIVHILPADLTKQDLHTYYGLRSRLAEINSKLAKGVKTADEVPALHAEASSIRGELDKFRAVEIHSDADYIKAATKTPEHAAHNAKVLKAQREFERASRAVDVRKLHNQPVNKVLVERQKNAAEALKSAKAARHEHAAQSAANNVTDAIASGKAPKVLGDAPEGKRMYEETIQHPGSTAAERRQIGLHNAKLMSAATNAARETAKVEADVLRKNALEHLARTAQNTSRKGVAIKFALPFTKANNPRDAAVLFSLHAPAVVSRMAKATAERDTVKRGIDAFNKTFKASAGSDPYMNRVRLSAAGSSDKRIAYHANVIRNAWKDIPPETRRSAFDLFRAQGVVRDGGVLEKATTTIANSLTEIGDVFKHVDNVDGVLKPADLNKWIPDNLKLDLTDIPSELKPNSPEWWQHVLTKTPQGSDPAQLLWGMTVAKEKVLTKVALKDNIRTEFAIDKTAISPETAAEFKRLGYKHVAETGTNHLYAPEIADDVAKTFELMRSQHEMNDLFRSTDAIMRPWKKLVTMYNIPGYYIRNSFGDVFVAHLAGVSGKEGLKSYEMSRKLMSRMGALPDDHIVNEAINQSLDPLAHIASATPASSGAKTLFLKNGKAVDDQTVWALFHQFGLSSGLVSTEFKSVFRTPGSLAASKLGQAAHGVDEMVGNFAGKREDYFRLAHFIHQMRTGPTQNLEQAAALAADSVRKYHFDYGDFTPTEKVVFSRVIPFYKWQRKAMPLMAEALLAQPGKALHYPKALRALSEASGYKLDENDPIPSSDQVIPEWIQDRMAMPVKMPFGIGGGNTTFMDPSTPFNDVVKSAGSPLQTVVSGLNPVLRVPIEESMGQQAFGNTKITSQKDYLMGQLPQVSAISQILGNKDYGSGDILSNPRALQLLTSLGLIENNDSKVKAELMARQRAKNPHRSAP